MTEQELEVAILDIVQDLYHKKYVGKLKVIKHSFGYQLKMWLNNPEAPITFITDSTDANTFLCYIKDELQKRHLELVEYYTGYKAEPEL